MSTLGLQQQVELQYNHYKNKFHKEPTSCLVKVLRENSKNQSQVEVISLNEEHYGQLFYVSNYKTIMNLCKEESLKENGFKIIQVLSFE
jgi:hypothetical protein